jgi:hypothetical protein
MSQASEGLPLPEPQGGGGSDSRILRFGVFALDPGSSELRKSYLVPHLD